MFTIVSTQRSGTHFLASLIGAHPELICLGESFHLKDSGMNFFKYLADVRGPNPAVRPHEVYAAWRNFYSLCLEHKPTSKEGGPIIMYNQFESIQPAVTNQLLSESVVVIHLVRRNLLRTLVSDHVNRNKLVPTHARVEQKGVDITLPVDGLLKKLNSRNEKISEWENRLRKYSVVTLDYECLSSNPPEVMLRLQRVLNVEERSVSTSLTRSNPLPLRRMLRNYNDVKNCLKGTQFEAMLEDG